MNDLSNINIENLARKKLQELCKKYKIKANLKTKELQYLLCQIKKGKKISPKYLKKNWFQNNKHYIIHSISFISLVVSIGYIINLKFNK